MSDVRTISIVKSPTSMMASFEKVIGYLKRMYDPEDTRPVSDAIVDKRAVFSVSHNGQVIGEFVLWEDDWHTNLDVRLVVPADKQVAPSSAELRLNYLLVVRKAMFLHEALHESDLISARVLQEIESGQTFQMTL